MKVHILALLFLASACNVPGQCKVGDASCGPQAFCYAGNNAKPGDDGVCVLEEKVPPVEPVEEAVDEEEEEVVVVKKPPVEPPPEETVIELEIIGFSPSEASHGEKLYIQGTGLDTVDSVTLNDVPAEVLSVEPNEVVVEVPKSMHCSGPVQMMAGDKTVASRDTFSYVPTASAFILAEGTGSSAFSSPRGLAIDETQNLLWVAEANNHYIRSLKLENFSAGPVCGNGVLNSVDGNTKDAQVGFPSGIAWDAQTDALYMLSQRPNSIRKYVGSEDYVSTIASDAAFGRLQDIAAATADNLYVTDESHCIWKVSSGKLSRFAGMTGSSGFVDDTGEKARFQNPQGICVDAEDNLYVADAGNHSIRKISPEGKVSTFAGSGEEGFVNGAREDALFSNPEGVAMDTAGNLYVADTGNQCIRRISPEGTVSTLADVNAFGPPYNVSEFSPTSIVVDTAGNLYVAEMEKHRVTKITLE